MEQTKEAILKKIHATRIQNWEKVFKQNPSIIESDYEAMDEWAKQQVMSYELWVNEMLMDDPSFNYNKTPEQLHELFLSNNTQ